MSKIYIIAGEASGDLHGSNLIKELHAQQNDLEIRCWGGELMESAGATLVKHYRDLAFMGFAEVLMNIRTIIGNISFCKKDIMAFQPDAVVMIDYPGFNLRIATFLKEKGIPVHYYISPQIWAWKESRIKRIKRDITELYCILPFEKAFYAKHNMDVHFVGNPLLDELNEYRFPPKSEFIAKHNLSDQPIVALLPGSRKQEIDRILPIMLEALSAFPGYQYVLAAAPSLPDRLLSDFTDNYPVKIVSGATKDLLKHADFGIITSGTATLEAAIIDLPQVICYKTSAVTHAIAKRLAKVKYIALANLIMDKEVVRELIQDECTPELIALEIHKMLEQPEYLQDMKDNYGQLRDKLGKAGASKTVATLLLKTMAGSLK